MCMEHAVAAGNAYHTDESVLSPATYQEFASIPQQMATWSSCLGDGVVDFSGGNPAQPSDNGQRA